MTTRKAATTAVLTGALAIATGGAYALGTQADDGSAAAASGAPARPAFAGHRPGPGHEGFGDLATKLGVDEAKLQAALEDLRKDMGAPGDRHGDMRDTFAKDLATELGTTQAKVEAAMKKLRAKYEKQEQARRDAFAEKLAAKLGLDASKVKEALKAPRGFRGRPGP